MREEFEVEAGVQWITQMFRAGFQKHSFAAMMRHYPSSMEEDEIASLLELHSTTSALHFFLRNAAGSAEEHKEIPDLIRSRSACAQARSLMLCHSLECIAKQFAESSIPMIPLRGPVLAQRIYGESWVRESGDLDILIENRDLEEAKAAMLSLGYSSDHPGNLTGPGVNGGHCIEFHHSHHPVAVELHLEAFPPSYPIQFSTRELLDHANEEVSIGSQAYSVLEPEMEMVLLSAHAGKHLWSRILWILDIASLCRRYPRLDLQRVTSLAKKSRCLNSLRISLEISEILFGFSSGSEAVESIQRSRRSRSLASRLSMAIVERNGPLDARPKSLSQWLCTVRFRAKIQDSCRNRLRILGNSVAYLLTPNQNDREFTNGVRIPPLVALVFRPFRLVVQYRKQIFHSKREEPTK